MTEQEANDKSAKRRGRRPVSPKEKKHPRNLSISDQAWAGLEKTASIHKLQTVSDLTEKIGLEDLKVIRDDRSELSELLEIPIYQRLQSSTQAPVAVFWSLLSFARRTAFQLCVADSDEFLCRVITQAITVIFYVGYTHPHVYINNPSAFLRWLSYRILLDQSSESAIPAMLIKPDEKIIKGCISQVASAIHKLESASHSPQYQALRMKAIDGLTLEQISRIFIRQRFQKTPEEVGKLIKTGLSEFREFYKESSSPKSIKSSRLEAIPEDVRLYCELAVQANLNKNQQAIQELEELLLKTRNKPDLDFWMNEIDYYLGPHFAANSETYEEQQEHLLQFIATSMDEYVLDKKNEIDEDFTFCNTKGQVREMLQEKVIGILGNKTVKDLGEERLMQIILM
jgi:hypothetical protein